MPVQKAAGRTNELEQAMMHDQDSCRRLGGNQRRPIDNGKRFHILVDGSILVDSTMMGRTSTNDGEKKGTFGSSSSQCVELWEIQK